MKSRYVVVVLMILFSTACAQKKTPQDRAQANQCFNGFHWEECGASGEQPPKAFLIHKPTKGCPASYQLRKKLFSERDGTFRDGCIQKPEHPGDSLPGSDDGVIEISIDLLYGGESLFSQAFLKFMPDVDDGTKRKT